MKRLALTLLAITVSIAYLCKLPTQEETQEKHDKERTRQLVLQGQALSSKMGKQVNGQWEHPEAVQELESISKEIQEIQARNPHWAGNLELQHQQKRATFLKEELKHNPDPDLQRELDLILMTFPGRIK